MLVLSRHKNDSIKIGDNITIAVVDIRGDKVRLGIDAPQEVPVHRQEVYDAIKRETAAGASAHPKSLINQTAEMKETEAMNNFGWAIEQLKAGCKVRRTGWNGKGMFIVMMSGMKLPSFNTQGTDRKVNDRTAKFIGEDTPLDSQPYIAMFTAAKQWQPGWLASQADILSNDWEIAP